jgi:hypothetical protein
MTAYFAENLLKARRQETDERLLVEAAQRDPRRFAELMSFTSIVCTRTS